MSLLIKALANAEKDKQAELSKKRAKPQKADAGLALELATIEDKKIDSHQDVAPAIAEKPETKNEDMVGLNLAAESFVDDNLSLAAEAGLITPSVATPSVAAPGIVEQPETAKQKVASTPVKSHAEADKAQHKPTVTASKGVLAGVANSPALPLNATAQSAAPQSAVQQKTAASVFVANQAVKPSSSKSALILLGVAGALMIWLGIEGLRYITELTTPEVAIRQPVSSVPAETTAVTEMALATNTEPEVASEQVAETAQQVAVAQAPANPSEVSKPVNGATAFKAAESAVVAAHDEAVLISAKPRKSAAVNADAEEFVPLPTSSRHSVSQDSAKSVPLQVSSRTPVAGVDPVLLSAYQAFNRGEDANAQQQYRQVLQRDVRNVDALLGMAAIAQRQGRDADAMGWYQKVLEIEPKNTIAQSAIVSPQANVDAVSAESRIKNLLVYQPEAAHLHAALGNVYAEQGQWASAQEAYFNASRFAPNSADYAFNLAISLDQLGKSGLALAQYQRALSLLNSTGASTPDKSQLEARIQALQSSN